MYHDNYSAVYSKYRVNYSKLTVTAINHSVNTTGVSGTTTTQYPNYCYKMFIITDNQSLDIPGNVNQIIEEGGANVKWRFAGPSLTGKMPKLYAFCSPHKLHNVAFNDDSLTSEVTTDPGGTGIAYFYVGVTAADGFTNPGAVILNVQIKYWVEYFDRKMLQAEQ